MRDAWNHHLARPLVFNINLHSTLESTWEYHSFIESYTWMETSDNKELIISDPWFWINALLTSFNFQNKQTKIQKNSKQDAAPSIPPPHHQPKPWEPRSPFVSTVLDQSPRLERPRLEHSACLTAPGRIFFVDEIVVFVVRFSRPKRLDFSEGFLVYFFGWRGWTEGESKQKTTKIGP